MSTTQDYITYVYDQIKDIAPIRYRKMFGEYMVYVNEKPLLMVCDNTCYVRIHPSIEHLMVNPDKGYPYDGAKEHYILDIDNADHCADVLTTLEPHVLVPKRKRKKTQKESK